MPKNSSGAADATRAAELPAGRELDALVAERVMGWTQVAAQPYPAKHRVTIEGVPPRAARSVKVPHYSTDIAAAWQVVEKMRALGWHPLIESRQGNEWWAVNFAEGEFETQYTHYAVEDTVPLAICRAALKTVAAMSSADAKRGGPTAINSGEAEE